MANAKIMQRAHPLSGLGYAGSAVKVYPAPEGFRCGLRAKSNAVSALSKALGAKLPTTAKASSTTGTRTAMWLGPDEWLLLDNKSNPIEDLMRTRSIHSAVDVSHRNTAIMVNGVHAADVVNAGCPQDLSLTSFPVGACSRTILGKVEVVLLRTKKDEFHLECWRSFAPYAFEFLKTAAKNAEA